MINPNFRSRLPGSKSNQTLIEEAIRVNHAGEYGAKRIYEGQLAYLKDKHIYETINHMKEQELKHLNFFENEITKRRIRPTLLLPLWHVAGFALGAATALMGKKAAMACTVAVEEAIDSHYSQQLTEVIPEQSELYETIARFRLEELEHKDTAIENDAQQTPFYSLLTTMVKTGCNFAIWVSKKF